MKENNFEYKQDGSSEKAERLKGEKLAIVRQNPIGAIEKMNEFGFYLKSKYPDCLDYRAFHVLIGSTPKEECGKFDFEGDDSVESFIDSFNKKINNAA